MLKCPTCGRVYEDDRQAYCLNDGTALFKADPTSTPTLNYTDSLNRQPYAAAAPPPKKKSNTLLILGGVALLMVFLFVGVVITIVGIAAYKGGSNTANERNTNVKPTPVNIGSTKDNYIPELKMAINSANNAQSTAYASLDASLLRNYYSGEALKSYTNDVETLRKGKIYQVSTMQQQDFEYFKVNDAATEAEVRVTETWETTVFQTTTKKCLLYYPPSRIPQVVYLKKASGGWMIDSTVYDAGIKKQPQQCPKKS